MQKSDALEKSVKKVLSSMKDCGFEIKINVKVIVDESLEFMGYTTRVDDGYKIVVSGFAVSSGMLESLLLHEMSHIYRMESIHASHDDKILTNVLNYTALKYKVSRDYQLQMLHQVVNHIQDLYADDVAFKVLEQKNIVTRDQIGEFFLNWIKTEPVDGKDEIEQKWINVAMMLNNAFALSNMERHDILSQEAVKNNELFLSKIGNLSKDFLYFKSFMTNLKENVDEKYFRQQLSDYLEHFMRLVKQS